MNVYKYTRYHSDFFNNLLVRFTPAQYQNDPFEGEIDETLHRQFNRELNKQERYVTLMNEYSRFWREVGIFSLSSNPDSLLMWAHYADSHRGILIELDSEKLESHFSNKNKSTYSEFGKIHKIKYSKTRPGPEGVNGLLLPNKQIPLSFLQKSIEWEYENEYRIFMETKDCDESKGDKSEINMFRIPEDSIKRIIIGTGISDGNIIRKIKVDLQEAKARNSKLRHVEIARSSMDHNTYSLDYSSKPRIFY